MPRKEQSKMKKVLFVIHSMGFGGAEKSLVNLLHELPTNQYEIDVLLFQEKGGLLPQLPKTVHVLQTPAVLRRLYGPLKQAGKYFFPKLIGTALSRAKSKTPKAAIGARWKKYYSKRIGMLEKTYDVAVAYVAGEMLYYVAEKVSAKRKLAWIHNDYRTAGYAKEYDAPYLAQMDGIVSVSEKCVQVLQEEFPRLAEKIHYIENITSRELVHRQAQKEKPLDFDGTKILSIGRLHPQKGFDLALQAASLLKQQNFPFQWYILGMGTELSALEQLRRQLKVDDCVHFLGTSSNPYPYMACCDMLAQTSRYEGKSVVLDEAKILAKPIVVTDYPTAKDQIENGLEGLIVPLTPQGIAQGIRQMAEDTALRDRIVGYLSENSYGNRDEVEKYIKLLDGIK